MNRSGKKYLKGRSRDIHEQDLTYQEQVAKTYLEIADRNKDKWIVINCSDKNKIKSKQKVHAEIIEKLNIKV